MAPASEDSPAALGGSPSATAIAKMVTPPPPIPPAMKEELLRRERQNAEAREQYVPFPPSPGGPRSILLSPHLLLRMLTGGLFPSRYRGLKKALGDITTISNATTRRLDRAYYSVLEKIGTLQSTIVALRELAGLSHDLSHSFSHDSSELITDISSQLEAFGGFEAQQTRLETLQGQVRQGRVRVRSLSERLDSVRLRIEGWEKADRHWQERTRKRLKVIWLFTSVLVFLVLLLFVTAQYMSEEQLGTLEEKAAGFANESLGTLQNMTTAAVGARPWGEEEEEEEMERAWHLHGSAAPAIPGPFQNATGDAHSRPTEAAAEMLRIFDEL